MKILRLLLFQLLVFTSVWAQENSLLWEISGKKAKTSWLYGTIHLQDSRVFQFGDSVMAKLDKADAYACEIAFDETSLLGSMSLMFEEDSTKTIRAILTDEEYARLKKVASENLGMMAFMIDKMKPILVATTLMESQARQDKQFPMDYELQQYAKAAGKKIISLETAEDQAQYLDEVPTRLQKQWLMGIVDSLSQYQELLEEVVQLYQQQKTEELLTLLQEISVEDYGDDFETWDKKMMEERNDVQLKGIVKAIDTQPTFIAVGTAHLFGAYGLIKQLREKGYMVEPVYSAYTKSNDGNMGITSWELFESPAGDFSVEMPGQPEDRTQKAEGTDIDMHMYVYDHPETGSTFSAMYVELPDSSVQDLDAYWKATLNNWRASYGELHDLKDVTWQGAAGKEFYADYMGYSIHLKALLRENDMVMLMFGGEPQYEQAEEVERFFNSLKFH